MSTRTREVDEENVHVQQEDERETTILQLDDRSTISPDVGTMIGRDHPNDKNHKETSMEHEDETHDDKSSRRRQATASRRLKKKSSKPPSFSVNDEVEESDRNMEEVRRRKENYRMCYTRENDFLQCVHKLNDIVMLVVFSCSDLLDSFFFLVLLKITRFRLKPSLDVHVPIETKKEGVDLPDTLLSTKTTSNSVLWNYITEEEWEHQKRKSTETTTQVLTEKSSILEEISPIPEGNGEEDLLEAIPNETTILTARKTREMRRHMRSMQEDEFLAFDDRNEAKSRHVREEDELEELDEGKIFLDFIVDPWGDHQPIRNIQFLI
jgi:hypothetical protein